MVRSGSKVMRADEPGRISSPTTPSELPLGCPIATGAAAELPHFCKHVVLEDDISLLQCSHVHRDEDTPCYDRGASSTSGARNTEVGKNEMD